MDLLSLMDRRGLGAAIACVSFLAIVLAWLPGSPDAGTSAAATAVLVPAVALGVVAVVVRPIRLIIGALVLGGAMMVLGIVIGF